MFCKPSRHGQLASQRAAVSSSASLTLSIPATTVSSAIHRVSTQVVSTAVAIDRPVSCTLWWVTQQHRLALGSSSRRKKKSKKRRKDGVFFSVGRSNGQIREPVAVRFVSVSGDNLWFHPTGAESCVFRRGCFRKERRRKVKVLNLCQKSSTTTSRSL